MLSCLAVVLFGLPETLQTVGPSGSESTLLMFIDVALSPSEAWGLRDE